MNARGALQRIKLIQNTLAAKPFGETAPGQLRLVADRCAGRISQFATMAATTDVKNYKFNHSM